MPDELAIYIVEDDDGYAELVSMNIREAGIANPLVRFKSGYDVLDHILCERQSPATPLLMLLDLNMPGMHGTEVIENIRNNPQTKAIPIVVLTTSGNAPEIKQCYELGCNLYLTKPVESDALVKAIRSLGLVFQLIRLPNDEYARAQ